MTAAPDRRPRLALVGNHREHVPAHPRLDALAPHLPARVEWVATETVTDASALAGFDGVWVVPGSPYASKDGALTAIRWARETGVPYLGTCGGFQHALIEYARTELGVADADDVQYDPDAPTPLIVPLVCSLHGIEAPLHVAEGSRLCEVYDGATASTELYHCQYGLNPDFASLFDGSDLVISAWDEQKEPRAVELPDHPFFVATLYQPELVSTPDSVHPLVSAFLRAVLRHAERS